MTRQLSIDGCNIILEISVRDDVFEQYNTHSTELDFKPVQICT